MKRGRHLDKFPNLSNIPLWNLLEEFFTLRATLLSNTFKARLADVDNRPVRLPVFTWNGPPGTRSGQPILLDWHGSTNDLLTLILQRSILGVECYVASAAWSEAWRWNIVDPVKKAALLNPAGLGKGTANCYYNLLPSQLSQTLSLRVCDPSLWSRVTHFYEKVRNPLFHGNQLATDNPDEVSPLLEVAPQI